MSCICKNIWIGGRTYKIMKIFNPELVEGYCIQLIENVFKKTFNVPMFYGAALREPQYKSNVYEIEKENVKLTISPNSVGNTTITITSDEETKVARSFFHLLTLICNIRNNIPARQFIAVPVFNDEVNQNFMKFKEDVLKLGCAGVDEIIFQKAAKLHFSINVFSLVDEQEIGDAKQALIDCKTAVIMPLIDKKLPLKLNICGIDSMQGNQSKVRVLYATAKIVDENGEFNFQILLDKIKEYFDEKGLTNSSKSGDVKIHMTLMNTKYRKRNLNAKKYWMKNIPINATDIFAKYKDYYFGQSNLNSINLCLMLSSVDGGYYKILTEINW